MAFCIQCGLQSTPDQRFCTSCGAALRSREEPPPPTGGGLEGGQTFAEAPTTVLPDPQEFRKPNVSRVLPVAFAVLAAVAIGGVITFVLMRGGGNAADVAGVPASPSTVPTNSANVTNPPTSPGPTTSPPAIPLPSSTEAALALSSAAAGQALTTLVARDQTVTASLAGYWVPQVSSKCPGLAVDLGPDFRPDGAIDTPSVTVQQILAFHVVLKQRYDAVTTTAEALGSSSRPSVCIGQSMWMSLVPQTFSTSGAALGWCQSAGIPVRECGARRVLPPGVSGTRFVPRQ